MTDPNPWLDEEAYMLLHRITPNPPIQDEGGEEVDTALYTPEQLSAAVPVCIWIGASVCALLCVLTRVGFFDGLINSILR